MFYTNKKKNMKKLITLFFIITISYCAFAQDYNVCFAANGIATSVDSVQIENITQGKCITVMGDDILHLVAVVNVEEETILHSGIEIFPNPSQDEVHISFYSSNIEAAAINIYDIRGCKVFSEEVITQIGTNTLNLVGFNSGTYFISVLSGSLNYSGSFISTGNCEGNTRIISESVSVPEIYGLKTEKSLKSVVEWQYNENDILIFRGFSDGYGRVNVYYIIEDVTVWFNIVACEDLDGNKYQVVTLGGMEIMAENLRSAKYKNNSSIPNVEDNTEWADLTTGGRCYYDNDSATYCMQYGALYNWQAVNTGNLCPMGWHIPAEEEWETIFIYLENNHYNYDGSNDTDQDYETNNKIAKSLCTTDQWYVSDVVGVPGNTDYPSYRNRSGFSAYGAGMRNPAIGYTTNSTRQAKFWASDEINVDNAKSVDILFNTESVNIGPATKVFGVSVRCIKD